MIPQINTNFDLENLLKTREDLPELISFRMGCGNPSQNTGFVLADWLFWYEVTHKKLRSGNLDAQSIEILNVALEEIAVYTGGSTDDKRIQSVVAGYVVAKTFSKKIVGQYAKIQELMPAAENQDKYAQATIAGILEKEIIPYFLKKINS